LRRHGGSQGIPGPGKRHEETVPLKVDLLPAALSERITEKTLVFREDLRKAAVAEALEELGGRLDVGEEESNRSSWQAFQKRPPPRQWGRNQTTHSAVTILPPWRHREQRRHRIWQKNNAFS